MITRQRSRPSVTVPVAAGFSDPVELTVSADELRRPFDDVVREAVARALPSQPNAADLQRLLAGRTARVVSGQEYFNPQEPTARVLGIEEVADEGHDESQDTAQRVVRVLEAQRGGLARREGSAS